MDNITKKYEISDFESSELCGLDSKELCRRALFLQDKLSDVLTSIESHIEVAAIQVFGEQKVEVEVTINHEGGIECSIDMPSKDLALSLYVQFAEELGLDYEDLSIEPNKQNTFLYWTYEKEDVLNNI